MINQRTQRVEVDAEAGQQAQQGRFHHRRPVRDAFPHAHLDAGSDQPERQMKEHLAPFFRRQGRFDPPVGRVLAKALDDRDARNFSSPRDRKRRQGIAGNRAGDPLHGKRAPLAAVPGQDQPDRADGVAGRAVGQQ